MCVSVWVGACECASRHIDSSTVGRRPGKPKAKVLKAEAVKGGDEGRGWGGVGQFRLKNDKKQLTRVI